MEVPCYMPIPWNLLRFKMQTYKMSLSITKVLAVYFPKLPTYFIHYLSRYFPDQLVCTYLYTFLHTFVHLFTHACTLVHLFSHSCTLFAHTCTLLCTHFYTCLHTLVNLFAYTCTLVFTHLYTFLHTLVLFIPTSE
jgi:hypothetical protein